MGLYNEVNLNVHRFSIIPTLILTLSYVMILKQGKDPIVYLHLYQWLLVLKEWKGGVIVSLLSLRKMNMLWDMKRRLVIHLFIGIDE